jgi:SAM-dependent methyltransferase
VIEYDRGQVAAFFDEYGEQERTRFETGRTPSPSLDVHLEHLRGCVGGGDHVLDVGADPGRFTIELARLGADVVVADVSPGTWSSTASTSPPPTARDTSSSASWPTCSTRPLRRWDVRRGGLLRGPLSYVVEQAPPAIAELARVVRSGGHVFVS